MNIQNFEQMRKNEELCDAVLRVDGTEFKIHKLVLASCSSFFKYLFTDWSSPDDLVYDISGVSANIMNTILEFAYTGNIIQAKDTKFGELFLAADRYDIPSICKICCKIMEAKLSPQTCISAWCMTNTFYYPELRSKAFSYILKHFEEVVARSDVFQYLSVEDLCKIIENDKLNVRQESSVFEAILKWIQYASNERKNYLCKLLQNVRLALTHPGYFRDHVLRNEMVRENRECKAVAIKALQTMVILRLHAGTTIACQCPLARPRVPQSALMALGGCNVNHATNIIEIYNSRTECWEGCVNSDSTPRTHHGTVFLSGSVYMIGGYDGLEQLSTTHKYDLINCVWHEVAPMHWRRCWLSVALLNGLIYAIGGFNGDNRLETAECYTPQINQWTMIAPMNHKRSDANSTTFDGKIYIFGGFDGEWLLASAEVYIPSTDQWTVVTRMSCRRSGAGVIAYANEIYVVGGFDGVLPLSLVEVYNPQTNSWHQVAPLLSGRSHFGIEVLEDQLFVVGGFNSYTTIRCVESFDVTTGLWSRVPNMAFSRSGLSCCVVYDLPNMADYVARYLTPFRR